MNKILFFFLLLISFNVLAMETFPPYVNKQPINLHCYAGNTTIYSQKLSPGMVHIQVNAHYGLVVIVGLDKSNPDVIITNATCTTSKVTPAELLH